MRTALTNLVTRRRTLVFVLIAALAASTAAWAYWAARSSGSATGKVGALSAPTLASATGGAESATLSWSSVSAPGSGPVKYYVSRDGSTPGGNCPDSSAPTTVTSCTDTGVSPGSHEYTVTAVWRSWSATSGVRSAGVSSKPTVTSTSPSSRGQGASGQTITVTGSHFLSGATVAFSGTGVTVNSTTFKSANELTLNISLLSSATTGARSVTVTNPDSGAGTGTNVFTVDAVPSVESTSPSSRGQGASSQNITVKGKNFASGATASFGSGVTVNSTTVKSSTELSVNVSVEPGASTGARTVTVTNPDAGVGSLASAFTVNAGPTVTSTSPSSRPQGASFQTVAVKGTGFVSGASVSFGSGVTVNSTTFKSSTELSVKVSVESGASTGARTVTVTNPDAGVGSLASAFTVTAAPNLESVSPSSRAQGASGQTITIKGTGFASGASASFSGSSITVESTTVLSSTELTAKISISSFASTGARTVTVTNSDGGSDSLSGAFTVDAAPNVTSISPSSGDRGGSESVAIKGSGFASGASSSFGSGITVNSTTFKSSTELIASITIEPGASLGSRTVTETNPDGGSDEGSFTVNGVPTVASASPSSRAQGASSQTVAIKGTNFESGTGLAASFSGTGITVNSTSFVSSTEVTANVTIASNATTGARNVTVTNPDTTSATGTGIFTVTAAPTVTSTSPNSRAQGASKQTVVVKGSGFATGASVSFGAGITVESTSFVSSTELSTKISVESGASTGARTVSVTNSDGGVGSLASGFTVISAPNVTSISPSSGDRGGSESVTIKGSGFASGASSSFGSGITVNSTSFKSSTELIASITIEPGASLGSRTVTETNPDGGSDEGSFTVNGVPTVASASPSSRAQGASSQTVAIKGTNFESGTGLAASFSGTGITVNSTSFVSSTEVTANVTIASNATTGARNVTVTNPDTTSATGTGIFTVTAAPTVTSTSPSSRGQGASKQTVAIKGTGFAVGATASFGAGILVESTSFVSSTELTSKISVESTASTGTRSVTVTNSDGGVGSLASGFTVNAGPSIGTPNSSFSGRAKISRGNSGEVKVTGSNFVNGAVVSISGGFTITLTTFVNTGELRLKVTAPNQKTKADLTITNPDGGSDTSEESVEST